MAIFCLYHLECSYFKVDFPVYFLYDKGNLITEDENMRDYRKRAERFFLKNRDKGIRNLMLIIAVGNARRICSRSSTPAASSTPG
jgi:hypothetical protein